MMEELSKILKVEMPVDLYSEDANKFFDDLCKKVIFLFVKK